MPYAMGSLAVSEVIDHVYASSVGDGMWMDLANKLAQIFATDGAGLVLRDLKTDAVQVLARPQRTDDATEHAYRTYYYKHDVWAARGIARRAYAVTTGDEIIPESEFEQTEIYRDFFRKQGIFRVMGAVLPISADVVGLIGIHRDRNEAQFSTTERATLSYLLPHLLRALQVRQRLAGVNATAERGADALAEKDLAVIVADQAARVIYANPEAEGLLRSGDVLAVNDGILTVHHVRSAIRLQRLIKDAVAAAGALDSQPGGVMSIPRPEQFPLSVLVAPYRATLNVAAGPMPAAIIMIRDPEKHTNLQVMLQNLFGLTPAEAKIANALASGDSIETIAAKSKLSHHTVRTQLKSISSKTGTSRQGELIALVLKATAFPRP